ncbi:MAG: phenylacetate--CoA ligase family protein [Bryobacteraceae bacterium]|nr:phenylacetate--CoA ligase family protein [Bryobacteraceae bacterium]
MILRAGRYAKGISVIARSPLDSERVLAFQNARLRALVRHCYHRVPYYRKLFDRAGLRPEEIRSVDDLPKIPPVPRTDFQFAAPEEICARGVDPDSLLIRRTSGSSGAPLTIRRRWFEERLLLSERLLSLRRLGIGLRSPRVTVEQLSAGAGWKQDLYRTEWQNRLGLYPKRFLDWRLPHQELVDRLAAIRPALIHGPPSILSWVADEMTDEDRRRIRPRLLTSGAETCTEEMRRRIERGFGAPLAEIYGSHEFVSLAWRPASEPEFAVYGDLVIVEVLKDDGAPAAAGEPGELVATALHSFAMPFLRYRLGDLVWRGSSEGWRPHSCSTLARIVGRMMDRFRLPSGRYVHPYVVARVLRDDERWLRRFQIVQSGPARFWIRIVPHAEPGPDRLAALAPKLAESLGEPAEVRVELVADLPPTSTGKFYPYVSLERYRAWGERPEPPPSWFLDA